MGDRPADASPAEPQWCVGLILNQIVDWNLTRQSGYPLCNRLRGAAVRKATQ